jgi:GNAT superfamily N-acetyltransferase
VTILRTGAEAHGYAAVSAPGRSSLDAAASASRGPWQWRGAPSAARERGVHGTYGVVPDGAGATIDTTGQPSKTAVTKGRAESVTADRHTQDDLVQIRRAVPADAAQIADLHVPSWQGAYRDQLPQDLLDSLDPAQRVPRWTASLERASWPRAGTIVAEDARELLGFAHLCPARDDDQDSTAVGEITSIYVLPGRWDQGIGRRLMTASLATLTEAGYESVPCGCSTRTSGRSGSTRQLGARRRRRQVRRTGRRADPRVALPMRPDIDVSAVRHAAACLSICAQTRGVNRCALPR